ncbi:hypothetical protein PS1M3_09480 [Pseudoalteromonas sp. PS1M3]|jgi:septal ring factor EnvC (AmiA/AmiB activator)|uniref:hypothetical protein n=1 Tax=Pseudoalteromonas sp. PS1M3 TaxID=87791 RepID=UPI001951BC08|nr:hypothetical protein [Pseudoalteromonas sp. PS1M3]BBW90861.1 hypothetical protein PS1M3_09480 [Pseudoalteromonas sp. PS1M3]
MSDQRGVALKKSKQKVVNDRDARLIDILKGMKKLSFVNVTALSEYVSEKFEEKYSEVISPSTLRRNKKYRKRLDKFQNSNGEVLSEETELSRLEEELMISEGENYTLEQQLVTAEETISKLLGQVSSLKTLSLENRIDGVQEFQVDDSSFRVILLLLEHVDDFEVKDTGIYDLASAIGDEELVIPYDTCPEFFIWYFKNTRT